MTAADATCLARALVATVTVERLKNAGASITDLSDPNKDLPASLATALPPATKVALGAAMQSCEFGRLIGAVFADSIAQSIGGGYQPYKEVPMRKSLRVMGVFGCVAVCMVTGMTAAAWASMLD